MKWNKLGWIACVFGTMLITACGDGGFSSPGGVIGGGGAPAPGGGFGATQGGLQDLSFARALIDEGRVPPPEALLVEGIFSEHDLPLSGEPCTTLFCVRGALALSEDAQGSVSAWAQIGLSSTIDPDTYQRPSTTFIATVDVSGSMGWGYGEGQVTPGAIARKLLKEIGSRLGPADRLAIVTYGSSVKTALTFVSGDKQSAITAAINGLRSAGSTNMEAGLQLAYSLADQALLAEWTDQTRVLLFTDVQPNVGATSPTSFETMVADGADKNVGITVYALGLGVGQNLLNAMIHLRGANAFGLHTLSDVDDLMDESWPWMASPIAYDLTVDMRVGEGVTVAESYGFPEREDGSIKLQAATIFLSKKRGALLVQLAGEQSALHASDVGLDLSYQTVGGDTITETIALTLPHDAQAGYAEQPSVEKAMELALLVSGMREAATLYASDEVAAEQLMQATYDRFYQVTLQYTELASERSFATGMLDLIKARAPQGDLYGQ